MHFRPLYVLFILFLLGAVAPAAQYLNLPNSSVSRFTVTDRVWPASHGEGDVCLWEDDKMAAVTKGIDDNICGEHDWWMSMGTKYGFAFTWFVIVYPYMYDYDGNIGTNPAFGDAAEFQRLFDAGHDVQAHGTGGINDLSDSLYDQDVRLTQKLLNDSIPGNHVLVYAYPSGDATGNKQSIVGQYYIGARGTTGAPNPVNRTTYLQTNDGSLDDYTIDRMIDDPSYTYYRGWLSSLSHQLASTGLDSASKQAVYDDMERSLAHIKSREDDIWMTVYRKASLYGQERDSHTLTVTSATTDMITFTLTDSMADSVFTYPLTVKFRLDSDWDDMTAVQNGSDIPYTIYWYEGNKYALIKAVPDQGVVTLTKTAATVVADLVFSPRADTYADSVVISLTTITTGADIYYTTDGSDPDNGDNLYSGTFTIYGTATVKAVAYKTGLTASGISSAAYTVTIDSIAPVISAVAAGGLATQVVLSFDGEMDAVSAGTAGNYTIDNGISVSAASLQSDNKTVVLTVSALSEGTAYTLEVNNVKDVSLNTIAAGSTKGFTFAAAPGDDGLTGYWAFDEDTDASFAVDLSGNGNTAIFTDGAIRETDRKGNAARFDGVDAHLSLGTSQWGIPSTNEFSVAMWFKYTGGWSGNLLSRGSVAPFSIPAHYSAVTVRSVVRVDGGTNYISGSTTYNADEWYHLAITYASGSYTIYINGDVDVETALTGVPSVYAGNTCQSGTGLNGWIDELRIYNKKLSAVEVAALYADSSDNADTTKVATPILQPDEGNYFDKVTVTISTFTVGATIRYTTDGSDPNSGSAVYAGPLEITSTTHLMVRGFLAGRDSSDMAEGIYNITPDTAAPAVVSVNAADDPTQVLVTFDETVDSADAEDETNYTVAGLTVTAASLAQDGKTVTLTVSDMTVDQQYTLVVGSITDRAVSPNTAVGLSEDFTYTESGGTVLAGIVSYWSMNTVIGSTVVDEEGTNDGTLSGGWTWSADGHAGGGIDFDGSGYLDVGTSDFGVDASKELTISAWFKADALGGNLFAKGQYVNPVAFQIYSGKLRAVVRFGGTNYISAATTLTADTWYHAALTVKDSTVTIYLDGQVDKTQTASGTISSGAGQYTHIGGSFNGIIDEMQVYDRALSAAEIWTLYTDSMTTGIGDYGIRSAYGPVVLHAPGEILEIAGSDVSRAELFGPDGIPVPVLQRKTAGGLQIWVPAAQAPGLYVLRIRQADGYAIRKVIVVH